jgi:hypothetical protein
MRGSADRAELLSAAAALDQEAMAA